MGGPGFAGGLAQGLQAGQERMLQLQQLRLQQEFFKSRQKQMETEDELKQLQLQALTNKLAFQSRLPSAQANLLGPQGAAIDPGTQGPTLADRPPQINEQNLSLFLQQAELNGVDSEKMLNFMSLADPTGQIRQLRARLKGPQIIKKGIEEEIVEISPEELTAQPASQPQPAGGLEGTPEEQAAIQTEQLRPMTMEENLSAAAQAPGRIPSPQRNQLEELGGGPSQAMPPIVPGMFPPTQPMVMPGPPQAQAPPTASQAQQPVASSRAKTLAPGRLKKQASVEESKVIGELAAMFPEKMATLQQELGRPPTFNEAGQFFTPAEFAQSFLAREERQRQGQIEVAQQTGVAAAERQFELAQKKEKIPEKPSAGERKAFAEDTAALEQARGIIDRFDPRFVGPIEGRAGNIRELIGNLGFDEAEFRGVVARTRNATIKAITGAQMGEAEADRIRQELPEFNLSPEAFIARMRLTYANLYDMARIRRETAGQTGIDLSGLAPLTAPAELDPKIREALRRQAGVTPAGRAQERSIQGQAKQDDTEFLAELPQEMQAKYRALGMADRAKFRERYLQKLETLPQGTR